jgi:predicted DNA-binding antitoxin AbrB/MazE fold protein
MTNDVDAIYDQGVFRPLEPVVLPDGTRVHLRIEEEIHAVKSKLPPAQIRTPRLANPKQAVEFVMEVREATDAGV